MLSRLDLFAAELGVAHGSQAARQCVGVCTAISVWLSSFRLSAKRRVVDDELSK